MLTVCLLGYLDGFIIMFSCLVLKGSRVYQYERYRYEDIFECMNASIPLFIKGLREAQSLSITCLL